MITRVDGDYIDSSASLAQYFTFKEGQQVTLTVERGDAAPFETGLTLDDAGGSTVENVVVVGVVTDSPAGIAGLQPDDLILAGNGQRFNSVDDLTDLHQCPPG